MNTYQALLAFGLAAAILTVTPGLDTAMVLRAATAQGARPARFAALGICLGCLLWAGVVSIGLGALLSTSRTGFMLLKWLGAAYLMWLGLKLLLRPHGMLLAGHGSTGNSFEAFRRGVTTNILNPKIGAFYITFLPQFVPAHTNLVTFCFLLALIHIALSLLWFSALIAATAPVSRLLAQPNVAKYLDRIAGSIFVGFAIKLSLAQQN